MQLARVVGTVVATRKDPRLEGKKLLVVKMMSPEGKEDGGYLVAVDTVDAGAGEQVLIVTGGSARMAEEMKRLSAAATTDPEAYERLKLLVEAQKARRKP